VSAYRRQRRGGRGVTAAHTKEDDWSSICSSRPRHDYVMFFTQQGQCYWLKCTKSRRRRAPARGKPVVNCIAMRPDEHIASLVPVRAFADDQFLFFATKQGV